MGTKVWEQKFGKRSLRTKVLNRSLGREVWEEKFMKKSLGKKKFGKRSLGREV